MNKLMKMATVVVGVGAMLSFAGCGDNQTSSEKANKASAKLSPKEEFVNAAHELAVQSKQAIGELGEQIFNGMADEAEKMSSEDFKAVYEKWMPSFKNYKVYLPLAVKAKTLAGDILKIPGVDDDFVRSEFGFDSRELEEFIEFDQGKQKERIEHMKASIDKMKAWQNQVKNIKK